MCLHIMGREIQQPCSVLWLVCKGWEYPVEVCICLFSSCSVTIQNHSVHVSMKTVGFGERFVEGCFFTSASYSFPELTRKQRCLETFFLSSLCLAVQFYFIKFWSVLFSSFTFFFFQLLKKNSTFLSFLKKNRLMRHSLEKTCEPDLKYLTWLCFNLFLDSIL